jgi:hypothetical protein
MAIPVEHREQVIQYFELVETISNLMKTEMFNNVSQAPLLAQVESQILLEANAKAAEILGFSYYPWPFGETSQTHYVETGEQNG